MDSNLVIKKNSETRRILGIKPSKSLENTLDKLISYDSKYNFKAVNLKHFDNLLNIDFKGLFPSDYIKIFKLFNRNLYYDGKIYHEIYKSLYEKIPYFKLDELVELMEFTAPFTQSKIIVDGLDVNFDFTHSSDNKSESESSDIVLYNDKVTEIQELQKDILKEITCIIDNRLKFDSNIERDEFFKINSKYLNSLNKISYLNETNAVLRLSEEIINYLSNKTGNFNTLDLEDSELTQALSSLNHVCDAISQKCIQMMCKDISFKKYKIKCKNELEFINLSIVDCVDLVLNYYSKGEIQILKFIQDCYEKIYDNCFYDLKSESIKEHNRLINLSINVLGVYNNLTTFLKNSHVTPDLDSCLCIYFKIRYSYKFLKLIDNQLFDNKNGIADLYNQLSQSIPKVFIDNRKKLNPKGQAILFCLICESVGNKLHKLVEDREAVTSTIENECNIFDVLRDTHMNVSKSTELSILDCLNVLESSYNAIGYVNHFAAKKMLDYSLRQYPKNEFESIVMLRLLFFTFKFPFTRIDAESENVKMAIDYIVNSGFKKNNFDTNNILNNIKTLEVKNEKNAICDFDIVLRSKHNINTSKMYKKYCISRGILRNLKRIKSIPV